MSCEGPLNALQHSLAAFRLPADVVNDRVGLTGLGIVWARMTPPNDDPVDGIEKSDGSI